jgi:hypothetical protein
MIIRRLKAWFWFQRPQPPQQLTVLEAVRDDAFVHRRGEQPFLRVPRQTDQIFSAAFPNSEANRSSSVICDAWEDGTSGSLDLFCRRPSTSASGAERGGFPPACREPSYRGPKKRDGKRNDPNSKHCSGGPADRWPTERRLKYRVVRALSVASGVADPWRERSHCTPQHWCRRCPTRRCPLRRPD